MKIVCVGDCWTNLIVFVQSQLNAYFANISIETGSIDHSLQEDDEDSDMDLEAADMDDFLGDGDGGASRRSLSKIVFYKVYVVNLCFVATLNLFSIGFAAG